MIAEIGHYALVLALGIALVQAVLPLIGAWRGIDPWVKLAAPASIGQAVMLAIAFAALTHAYVVSDFSVYNVFQNSHSTKPLLYKLSGVWGNHEGSMLLWVLILALFGAAVAVFGGNLPDRLKARVLAIQGLIGIGFLLFILLTSNPFARIAPVPADGRGLNPILQDPGLAAHPPFLYLGYVGFSVAFSFAVAALIEGRVDAAWARWVRPWALAAWCCLTVGIALGSYWAYYELGWGGWWFWDPVENASFMPWLAGTALIHSAIVVEKRDALKSWTILLAILAFSLSLLGTFLVRSGVLTSVHAFATDPARGVFILAFLIVVIGGSLALYALRAPTLKAGGLFAPISREGALVLNNLLLATATATVLLGTLYPLLLDALTGEKVTVGGPFFNATFLPLMTPLVMAMVVGPLLAWKRGDLAGALGRLKFVAMLAALVAIVVYWRAGGAVWPALGIALSVWLIVAAPAELYERAGFGRVAFAVAFRRLRGLPRATWGAAIAHLGVGLTVLGIVGSTAWTVESQQVMKPGDVVTVGPVRYRFDGVEEAVGPNYAARRGKFMVTDLAGNEIGLMQPEARRFFAPPMETTEAAIRPSAAGDLYAVLGEADGRGGYLTRLYSKPLIIWIWAGALVMAMGGVMSLSDRRHRVGAPTRARTAAGAAEVKA
ncbi:MAG: heme lyase CcmF/NrfE family subunit [Alphaproteobacteria bacterium]|jgi:cytochrome c-type biogenesis protein CcmF|nr:heme lyase CcmF/NrfE family subunit [Alphaproteobacteria bacterium]